MSDTVTKYWEEQERFEPQEIKQHSEDVLNILDLFRLLEISDKVTVKRLIKTEKLL